MTCFPLKIAETLHLGVNSRLFSPRFYAPRELCWRYMVPSMSGLPAGVRPGVRRCLCQYCSYLGLLLAVNSPNLFANIDVNSCWVARCPPGACNWQVHYRLDTVLRQEIIPNHECQSMYESRLIVERFDSIGRKDLTTIAMGKWSFYGENFKVFKNYSSYIQMKA